MTLRTVFRRSAVPVVAAVALGALAAVPAEAASVGKPTSLKADNSYDGFVVSWKKPSGATGYKIQWSTSSKFSGAKSLSTSLTKKTVTGLSPGKKYYVRVIARKGSKYGSWSSAVARTRWTPTVSGRASGFAVTRVGSDLKVSWKRPAARTSDSLSYTAYVADNRQVKSTDSGRTPYYESKTVKTSSTAPSVTVPGPEVGATGIGATVYVKVDTVNWTYGPKGDGLNADTRLPVGISPAAPSADAVTYQASCSGFVARWKPGSTIPEFARGVEVEVTTPGTTPTVKIYTGYQPAESVTVTGLDSGVTYEVRARSINGPKKSSGWTDPLTVTPSVCDPTDVRVATYNVTGTNSPDELEYPWSGRKGLVADVIESDADLVGLQETRWAGGQLSDLLSELGPDWSLADTDTTGGEHLIYRNTILETVGTDTYVSEPGKGSGAYGVGQMFAITGTDTRFIALTMHATTTTGSTDESRAAQVDEVLGMIVTLQSANGTGPVPVVFTGDVNLALTEWKDTQVRATLGGVLADAEYWASTPGVPLWKYNSQNAYDIDHSDEAGVNVDGLFHSSDAAPKSWNMVTRNFNSATGKFTGQIPADHNMIVGTFAFPDPTP